jgi:hypothetical protein
MAENVARTMHDLLLDVVVSGEIWRQAEADLDGEAEGLAYEDLIQSILSFSDAYGGFESIQRTLHEIDRGDAARGG